MFRQGDILIRRVNELPQNTKPVATEGGRVVLAYGEVTGHSHTLTPEKSTLFVDGAGRNWVVVTAPDAIEHQEHNPIPLEVGVYEVIHQVEYTPQAIRRVLD